MTDFDHDPPRLLESLTAERSKASLRHDLELARRARVDYSVDAGFARFESTLAGASTLPAGGTVAGFAALRWFLGATLLLGIGVSAWLLSQQPDPQARAPAIASIASIGSIARADDAAQSVRSEDGKVAEIVASVPRGPSDPSSVVSSESESSPGSTARESVAETKQHGGTGKVGVVLNSDGGEPASVAASPRPTSKSLPTSDPALDEAKLIDAARKRLAEDPAAALALTEQAAKRFPKGAMVQERRGYAILALIALDRVDEAEQRASEYLERWPKGPLSRRIREGLSLLP